MDFAKTYTTIYGQVLVYLWYENDMETLHQMMKIGGIQVDAAVSGEDDAIVILFANYNADDAEKVAKSLNEAVMGSDQ